MIFEENDIHFVASMFAALQIAVLIFLKTAIKKNNPKKIVRSVGDGEVVEFDVVVGEKRNEAANVTGPNGTSVKGSPYAADRSKFRGRWFPRHRYVPRQPRVNDLKRELEARNLSAKGLKSQLVARLTNALKNECEKESGDKQGDLDADKKAEDADESIDDEKKKDKEDDKKSSNEKDKIAEKLNFPDTPSIIVQPSKTAKNGKFDCTVMSLSLLLDYWQEDNKEHSFEVSLFAELFNEMMMRDFGFRIYRALVEAPETKDDEKVLEDSSSVPTALTYRKIRQRYYGVLFNTFQTYCQKKSSVKCSKSILIKEILWSDQNVLSLYLWNILKL